MSKVRRFRHVENVGPQNFSLHLGLQYVINYLPTSSARVLWLAKGPPKCEMTSREVILYPMLMDWTTRELLRSNRLSWPLERPTRIPRLPRVTPPTPPSGGRTISSLPMELTELVLRFGKHTELSRKYKSFEFRKRKSFSSKVTFSHRVLFW